MELTFIPGDFSGISEERRSVLSDIANQFDGCMSLDMILNKIRANNACLSDEEMLFVEDLIRSKMRHRDFGLLLNPAINEIRVDKESYRPVHEMVQSQFLKWDSGNPLYVKMIIENRNYPTGGGRLEYSVSVRIENGETFRNLDSILVDFEEGRHFCVARSAIYPPKGFKKNGPVLKGRVVVHAANGEQELAGVDFMIVDVPEYNLSEGVKILSAYLYEGNDRCSMLEALSRKESPEIGMYMKFRHAFTELADRLHEVEITIDVAKDDSFDFITRKALKAKCRIENGEAVYVVDEIILDQLACKALEDGKYGYCGHIWGHELMEGHFSIGGRRTVKKKAKAGSIQPEFVYRTGYRYDAQKEVPKDAFDKLLEEFLASEQEEERDAYDYLSLSSLSLFKQETLDKTSPGESVEGLTAFKEGFGSDIVIYSVFEVSGKSEEHEPLKMSYNLYDNTGRLLNSAEGVQKIMTSQDGSETLYSYANFPCNGTSWGKGIYRIEESFNGDTVISLRFEIGDRDITGEFEPETVWVDGTDKKAGGAAVSVSEARQKLDELVGLKKVKDKINSLGQVSRFAELRQNAGLPYRKESLHACFVGNSGTGKSTVAELVGQIYNEMGLLSKGHVIYKERKDLAGQFYDSEQLTEQAVTEAKGGVLFIKNAHSLYIEDDSRDPGAKVIEALISALSNEENRDWMLILSGEPDRMQRMLQQNKGLKALLSDTFIFDDLTQDELIEVADLYFRRNSYVITAEAHRAMESVIANAYASKTDSFGNARYVNNMIEKQIIPAMATRVSGLQPPLTQRQLTTIEKEDMPAILGSRPSKKMAKLEEMVGLANIKQSIASHLNFVQMLNNRMKLGLHTSLPPLHMVFTGNPGTGKTTVADFIGEIYASMGILSNGEVIKVEKQDLVSNYIGGTEKRMREVLDRARGNVLFIDEAYQLWSEKSDKDFGKIVVNSLMTALSHDHPDMIVILAGYKEEMDTLMSMNIGLPSRFPYTFHFEDYSTEELIDIAELTVKREKFILTPEAHEKIASLISGEVDRDKSGFGNARFVKRLIMTSVLPMMADRIAGLETVPDRQMLTTITAEDIPDTADDVKFEDFDEAKIADALSRLDALVGLKSVKRTIHNFVDIARYMNAERQQMFGNLQMKWNFVGNTGTGKSTVAKIMADILKAMGLIDKGNVIELKGESLYNVPEYRCDEILRKAMEKSKYGMLFVDSDAPMFRNAGSWSLTGDQLRIKLASLTAELGGNGAIIIAECEAPRHGMATSLAGKGVFDIDRTLVFEDYSPDELFEILVSQLKKHKTSFSSEAADKMKTYIDSLCRNRSLSLANASTMKLLSQSILEIMYLRESKDSSVARRVVLLEDVDSFEWHKPYSGKIGF